MTMKRPHRTGTVVFADATATTEASKETFEFTVRLFAAITQYMLNVTK